MIDHLLFTAYLRTSGSKVLVIERSLLLIESTIEIVRFFHLTRVLHRNFLDIFGVDNLESLSSQGLLEEIVCLDEGCLFALETDNCLALVMVVGIAVVDCLLQFVLGLVEAVFEASDLLLIGFALQSCEVSGMHSLHWEWKV